MNKVSFIHTHYLPQSLLKEVDVESCLVALESYPDLLMKYYGDYEIFSSLEECIFWHKNKYSNDSVRFSIENIAMLRDVSALKKAKDIGLAVVQLFHSKSNVYFDKKIGLTELGCKLLNALIENDLILDLSHLNDCEINCILDRYSGRVIVSHCVSSELIETIHPRTNTISKATMERLSDRGCIFGIPFVNDLVSRISHDTYETDEKIVCDIISQILYFAKCVGAENVALGPDFMDLDYFTKVFKHEIKIPEVLYDSSGYQQIFRSLRDNNFSDEEIYMMMSGNVKRIIM